jgi:methyl-accepting chemotaxis protein
MKWFYNLKIAHKIGLGFALSLGLSALIALIGISRMGTMDAASDSLNDSLRQTSRAADISNSIQQYRVFEFKAQLDPSHADDLKAQMDQKAAAANNALDAYEKGISASEDRQNFKNVKTLWKGLESEHDQYMREDRNREKASYKSAFAERSGRFVQTWAALGTLGDWNAKHGAALSKVADETFHAARTQVVVVLLLVFVGTLAISRFISKLFVHILKEVAQRLDSLGGTCVTNLQAATEALAHGDVTAKIPTATTLLDFESKDEFGQMAKSLNTIILGIQSTVGSFVSAQDSLSKMIGETKSASDGIAVASSEVAAGNSDLSQRTEQQAASLEETASSMEEMASTVKQNADNARQANQLAAQARESAERGGQVMGNAVATMDEINVASKRIADIISVIDEIAFQTNLLALNAAVEAARVGEQGRGFAVVAAEVRNLAGRSATAAKEIKSLVQDSVQKVQEGSSLVNQSGQQLDEIVDAVKKVADIIAEISAAAQEQSEGISQVNKAVVHMDQATQQNAALVEEITAASQSTSSMAGELQALVASFKVDPKYILAVATPSAPKAKPAAKPAARSASHLRVAVGGARPSAVSDEFEEF